MSAKTKFVGMPPIFMRIINTFAVKIRHFAFPRPQSQFRTRSSLCVDSSHQACFYFVIILRQLSLLLEDGNAADICASAILLPTAESMPFNLFTMNTANIAARKYNERDQFPKGVRINATKSEQDASKIFMGGLSPELNKQALLEYLSQFGEIIDFIIKRDPTTLGDLDSCFLKIVLL